MNIPRSVAPRSVVRRTGRARVMHMAIAALIGSSLLAPSLAGAADKGKSKGSEEKAPAAAPARPPARTPKAAPAPTRESKAAPRQAAPRPTARDQSPAPNRDVGAPKRAAPAAPAPERRAQRAPAPAPESKAPPRANPPERRTSGESRPTPVAKPPSAPAPAAPTPRGREAAPEQPREPARPSAERRGDPAPRPTIDTGPQRRQGLDRSDRSPDRAAPSKPPAERPAAPPPTNPRTEPRPGPSRPSVEAPPSRDRDDGAPSRGLDRRPTPELRPQAPAQARPDARPDARPTPVRPDREARGNPNSERNDRRDRDARPPRAPGTPTPVTPPAPPPAGPTLDSGIAPTRDLDRSTRPRTPTIETGVSPVRGLDRSGGFNDRDDRRGRDWDGGRDRDRDHRRDRGWDHDRYGHGRSHAYHHARHHDYDRPRRRSSVSISIGGGYGWHDPYWAVGYRYGSPRWYDCRPYRPVVYRPVYVWNDWCPPPRTYWCDSGPSWSFSFSIGSGYSHWSTSYGYTAWCGPTYVYPRYYRSSCFGPYWQPPSRVWCFADPAPVYRASSVTIINTSSSQLELYGDDDPFAVMYDADAALEGPAIASEEGPSLNNSATIDAAASGLRSAARSDLLTAASALWREDYAFGVRTILAAADRSPRLLAAGLEDLLTDRDRQDLRLALLRVETPPRQAVHERDAAFASAVLHAALGNRDEAARWLTVAERLGETSPTLRTLKQELGVRTTPVRVQQARH